MIQLLPRVTVKEIQQVIFCLFYHKTALTGSLQAYPRPELTSACSWLVAAQSNIRLIYRGWAHMDAFRTLTTLVVVRGSLAVSSSKNKYLWWAKLFFAAHLLNLQRHACPYTCESPSISKPRFVFNSVTRTTQKLDCRLCTSASQEKKKSYLRDYVTFQGRFMTRN